MPVILLCSVARARLLLGIPPSGAFGGTMALPIRLAGEEGAVEMGVGMLVDAKAAGSTENMPARGLSLVGEVGRISVAFRC